MILERKLFLMRHAEAEEKSNFDDTLRALTRQGIDEATKAGQFLQSKLIDKILVSSAKRTIQTMEIIQSKIKCLKHEILPLLYNASSEEIIEVVCQQKNVDRNILVIAHNPGIFKAALKLMDTSRPEYDSLITAGMPTAKIVEINFTNLAQWHDITY